ncbi:MAG: helix-turn-helix domain-containing protein [Atopobiaceae bacterium]|nr:helix-turn-helix domain-containing protein [Atopobiaceae bacterium]
MNTVERMCRDGVLPAVRVGRQWRIDTRKIMEAFDG